MKSLLFLLSILLLAGGATEARGQSALDGFDPNANGIIFALVVQPDGKILIGGDFTALSPNGGASVTRNRIARLKPDGTLDAAFNPDANLTVTSIALQPDGRILVGGFFTSIGGQMRNRMARLDPVTGAPDSFDPNSTGIVYAIAVQPDGKILVGGTFNGVNSIGNASRNRIARLDPETGLADSFDPNANGIVRTILVQPNGKILVGGQFGGENSIAGATRNRLARLDPASGLADSFDPNVNNTVLSLALQADGKVVVGGAFNAANSIGDQTRNYIARLDATTGAADSFNPNASGIVFTVAVQADGKILAGGQFFGAGSIGGQTRNFIARLDPITGAPDAFDPNATNEVRSVAVQQDGKILLAGIFGTLAPNGGATVTRNRIARLETDGRLDQTLNLSVVPDQEFDGVFATAVQPDGKILIGGEFSSILGTARSYFARLHPDGTLDTAFNPNPNGGVYTIAVQADGRILVGGRFNGANSIGGQARNGIARLNPDGTVDAAFNPNANSTVDIIVPQPDGRILVGGRFTSIGGQTRNRIARLDPTTGAADSFNPNANAGISAIAVQADGKILVGGEFLSSIGGVLRRGIARLDPATGTPDSFDANASGPTSVYAIAVQADGMILVGGFLTSIGGQPRRGIARLDPITGLADSFDPNAEYVYSITLQADGKILVGGLFHGIGGQPRDHIARLDPTGAADSFNPNANNTVASIAVQTDGKVLVGGFFFSIGGATRPYFARLTNDTIALQNLAVSQSAITWTRSGSSAQLTRVSFEYSADNVNYTPLGNGMPSGKDWSLTGLDLPLAQSFYIRARGYYRGGNFNGSESITESVRNAFITPPPAPTAVASRKTHGVAGTFDIPLPVAGSGIECRSAGATNDYELVFTFPSAVTFQSAALTAGQGSVSSTSGNGTSEVVVNLTGITSAQRITVTLFQLSDGTNFGDLNLRMGVLVGDTNGNGTVNATDIGQTKAQSGQSATAENFRTDVNANGSINATDVGIVKSRSGTSLP